MRFIFLCLVITGLFMGGGCSFSATKKETPVSFSFTRVDSLGGVIDMAFTPLPQNDQMPFETVFLAEGTSRYHTVLVPRYADTIVTAYRMQAVPGKKSEPAAQPFFEKTLPANTVFVLQMDLPETLTVLQLCLQTQGEKACWVPRYNGESEGLLLNPRFEQLPMPPAWQPLEQKQAQKTQK